MGGINTWISGEIIFHLKMNPKVSIALFAYNAEKYIFSAIDSILNQIQVFIHSYPTELIVEKEINVESGPDPETPEKKMLQMVKPTEKKENEE